MHPSSAVGSLSNGWIGNYPHPQPLPHMKIARLGYVSGILAGFLFLVSCQAPTSTAPAPKLAGDSFTLNQPGTRHLSFAQDALIEGVREKTIWAEIEPNNTFITRVVVEWGDALPGQAEVTYTMQNELEPRLAASRFTGNTATYSTQPDTWGVKLALRGDGPDVIHPGYVQSLTGNTAVDTFLTHLNITTYISPSTTPAPSLRDGSRIEYVLHVFYKRDPAATAPVLGVYLPVVRSHTYGPAIPITSSPPVGRPVALQFQALQLEQDVGMAGRADAGDMYAVDLRVERAVTRPVTLHFYSDPENSLEVLDANGQVVTSATFTPGTSDAENPFLHRWKVRVAGTATGVITPDGVSHAMARQLWVHSSGYAAGQLILE